MTNGVLFLTRRQALAWLAGLLLRFGTTAAFAEAAAGSLDLTIHASPTGSLVLADLVDRNPLAREGLRLAYASWRSPDELRGGLTSGQIRCAMVPSYVGANLRARGLDLGLLAVSSGAGLALVATDPKIDRLAALAGRKLAVPFYNDMPGLLLRYFSAREGFNLETAEVNYTASPNEAALLLASGRADAAVLPEPFASAAIKRAKANDRTLTRVLDFQILWREATGSDLGLPTGGLVIERKLFQSNPALFSHLLAEFQRTSEVLPGDAARMAVLAARVAPVDPEIAVAAQLASRSQTLRARDARPALERFFSALAESNPAIIGGRLPDDEFYLL
jgi:NitT/TauT family transport system substrate-binding protein